MLVGCDLLGYIDGSIPCPSRYKVAQEAGITPELTQEYKDWRKHDSAVMALLAGTLSSSALSFIVGSKTSKEVWYSLEDRYAKLSKFKAFELKTSMQKIRKGNDSIDKYMERFKTVRDQLFVAGILIPDDEIVSLILNGLHAEYATIRLIIRTKESSTSLTELRTLLLDVEADLDRERLYNLVLTRYFHPRNQGKGGGRYHHNFSHGPYRNYNCYAYRKLDVGSVQSRGFINHCGNSKCYNTGGISNNLGSAKSKDLRNSNGCHDYDFSGGVRHQSVSFPGDNCQICSQFGHIAKTCPQRSAPRQVVAVGFSLQCQICFKRGHSAAECFHRHHYDFQLPCSSELQAKAVSFSSQPSI
ncbi:uncharacterized protein LOC133744204 [Rosa rugosa]|uniref:uncharacterized protein LOC133744204 n=1 Tax=Rosa rugosa TaxID=74645 RepID=UPI002B40F185|nr:uncharacterized protein LOC133744204 [Rosa rugosa]